MEIKCDVLVVGAGPVGTVFSYTAAKNGADVLMVDRKNEVAAPLRGGEAASKFLFESMYESIPVLKKVYRWPINETVINNPISKITTKEDKWISIMINRKEVEKNLAQQAINAGAKLMLGATIHDVSFDGKKIKAGPLPIIKANLYYRNIGSNKFMKIKMRKNNGKHIGIIPGMTIKSMGIEYYIEVSDKNHTSFSPKSAPTYTYKIKIE